MKNESSDNERYLVSYAVLAFIIIRAKQIVVFVLFSLAKLHAMNRLIYFIVFINEITN